MKYGQRISRAQQAERDAEIGRRITAGERPEKIALDLGLDPVTIRRAGRRVGAIPPPVRTRMSAAEIERARALLEDGAGYYQTAASLGRSRGALQAALPGYALSRQEIVERQNMGRIFAKIESRI